MKLLFNLVHFVDLILLFGMIRLMRVIQVPNFKSFSMHDTKSILMIHKTILKQNQLMWFISKQWYKSLFLIHSPSKMVLVVLIHSRWFDTSYLIWFTRRKKDKYHIFWFFTLTWYSSCTLNHSDDLLLKNSSDSLITFDTHLSAWFFLVRCY
jgi:hypothetical protein